MSKKSVLQVLAFGALLFGAPSAASADIIYFFNNPAGTSLTILLASRLS